MAVRCQLKALRYSGLCGRSQGRQIRRASVFDACAIPGVRMRPDREDGWLEGCLWIPAVVMVIKAMVIKKIKYEFYKTLHLNVQGVYVLFARKKRTLNLTAATN